MKIRKAYQGTVPENKILDTYSESQTDTYSCNYVNKAFGGKILWTNPNPTNDFVSQTININFSNYDMYEVVFYQATNHNERELPSGKIRVGKGSILSYVPNNIYRAFSGTNTSIQFEDTSEVQNDRLIPAYVIGYKTGLFS